MRPALSLPVLAAAARAAINWDVFEHGVVDSFRWSRPFPDDGTDPGGFHVNCKAEGRFYAKMYKLSDLWEEPPAGLAPWHDVIEDFLGHREYIGSWDGVDHKGQDREIVVMEYVDVPDPVKHWIEEQQLEDRDAPNSGKWLFAVLEKPKQEGQKIMSTVAPKPTAVPSEHDTEQVAVIPDKDKILVFPAGSVYENMPLWVSKGSRCERDLSNLTNYKPQAIDHSILAWVVDHTKPQRDLGRRDITFKIEAMSVTESEDGKRSRLMWERLHRAVKRNDRRNQKEERLRAKREMELGKDPDGWKEQDDWREKDEL
ncbi:hypothetical protein B0H67DRAFT_544912 [Lasiosphaeris hirsuta]|uniref:Uncharacterized protein n=1 Tax=Lasiosphaeris hirsuta TaxID=260670 RepID=A0AA39ZVU8_9PEZI|nr:hypothetical protein B0H67DRAFT_544912 [Lasiosphaeris hirsuta]